MYLDLLSRVSLTIAGSRQVCDTLLLIVNGLAGEVGFALARIWLMETAENNDRHLQLQASAGRSIVDPNEEWKSLDGRFRRFELGSRKIGRVASTGEAVLIEDVAQDDTWMADREWSARERIVSFAAHPLVFQGEVLGVLAVFSRQRLTLAELHGLRPFADHAAVSLANARAFEELDALRGRLELENAYLQEEVREALLHHDIIGQSPALYRILQQVELVAPTDASVLILGESGTGKELVARAIHERSRRKSRPLVKVNCASVPRELFESEFFGHVRGAFTGALKDRVGRFQLADHGTLFLDEVGEIPLELQSKLLRVLQEGEFERVGDDSTRKVNVRIIAATNRDLGKEAAEKRFREDLYYRLSVFPIQVPPLRDRREDIPSLASHFIRLAALRLGLGTPPLTEGNVRVLMHYDWPGNIRELQHVLERAVILGRGQHLPLGLPGPGDISSLPKAGLLAEASPRQDAASSLLTAKQLRDLEIRNYQKALEQAQGKVYGASGAAALLGVPPTTLLSRLKSLGVSKSG